MSFKCVIICATLAIARAGYLQPTISAVPTIRYAHSVVPVSIPQPPITYSVPPKAYAESLPPVITTSYGYRNEHTPVPAPIIRAEPVHVAQAPTILPAPAYHQTPLARIGFAASAPISSLGFGGHFDAAPLAFGAGYTTGLGLGRYSLAAPATFGYAGHLGGYAGHLGGYAGGYRIAAPAPLAYPAHLGLAAATPLTFGKSYATDFGLGYGRYGGW